MWDDGYRLVESWVNRVFLSAALNRFGSDCTISVLFLFH